MDRRAAFFDVVQRAVRSRGMAVMGICNVTPDSFSDGGAYIRPDDARARVDALIAEGADIVDIGGESTRPGAPAIPAAEQLARVLDVVRYAAERSCVSIDTADPVVAAACLEAGASCLNDVSCMQNPELGRVVAATNAAYILMHARGTQSQMRGFSTYPDNAYGDVIADVLREWNHAADRAKALGVRSDALIFDPGLGFDKNARHSEKLFAHTSDLVARAGVPVLIGASRKSFLALDPNGQMDKKSPPPNERIGASLAAVVHSYKSGVAVVRVHDALATIQAIELTRRLERYAGGAA